MLLGLIRGLETLCDVIEYGPVKAAQINTSVCPEAERAASRILGNLEKENYTGTRLDSNPFVIKESEKESVLDQEEEDMIDKAVAEKGYY